MNDVLFPKVSECRHFHYRTVHFNALSISVVNTSADHLFCRVQCDRNPDWTIRRSLDQFRRLDALVHTCVFARAFSRLPSPLEAMSSADTYVRRLNRVLIQSDPKQSSPLTCVLVLNWFECDNNGLHTICQESEVNRRAIGAAFVVKRHSRSESADKSGLNLEIGELISIIELNSFVENDAKTTSERRFWSKGKKGIEVGFFPSECIQMIDNKSSEHALNPLTPRPSKMVAFFHKLLSYQRLTAANDHNRSQSRRQSKTCAVEPTPAAFGRDLCEQLFEGEGGGGGGQVPPLISAGAAFIETRGLVDGIYRLSGAQSNVSRLRHAFDRREVVDLWTDGAVNADVHSVSSCMKLFFRLLPNPLLTFRAYDAFVACIRDSSDRVTRVRTMRPLVRSLPPPHMRTLRALIGHLSRVAKACHVTGMTAKNLAIVWAPNLLRSPDVDQRSIVGDLVALQNIGVQAVVTQFLIENFDDIFDDRDDDRRRHRRHCRPLSTQSLDSFFSKVAQTIFASFLPQLDDTTANRRRRKSTDWTTRRTTITLTLNSLLK